METITIHGQWRREEIFRKTIEHPDIFLKVRENWFDIDTNKYREGYGDDDFCVIIYNNNNVSRIYWVKDNLYKTHSYYREDIFYTEKGLSSEKWTWSHQSIIPGDRDYNFSDVSHRDDDLPAITKYSRCQSGVIISQTWKIKGNVHRDNDKPAIIEYYDTADAPIRGEFWYRNNLYGRDNDKPSIILYNQKGIVIMEKWHKDNIFTRDNNPAEFNYYPSGNIKCESWIKNGSMYRENDLPAAISYYDSDDFPVMSETWYDPENGQLHREDEPAYIVYYLSGKVKTMKWILHGMYFNPNGPSHVEHIEHINEEDEDDDDFVEGIGDDYEYYWHDDRGNVVRQETMKGTLTKSCR